MKTLIFILLAIVSACMFVLAFTLLLMCAMHIFDGSPMCITNVLVALVMLFISWLIYRELDRYV